MVDPACEELPEVEKQHWFHRVGVQEENTVDVFERRMPTVR